MVAAAVAVMAWILLKYKYIKPKSEIFSKIRLNFQNRNEQYYIRTIYIDYHYWQWYERDRHTGDILNKNHFL